MHKFLFLAELVYTLSQYYVRPHPCQELMESVGSNGSFHSQHHAGMLCEVYLLMICRVVQKNN